MPTKQKEKHVDEARALYAAGADANVIAAAIGVSPRTVRRWAQADAEAGLPWRRAGEPLHPPGYEPLQTDDFQHGPAEEEPLTERLCRRLEQRLARLINAGGGDAENPDRADADDAGREDRMLKVCRVLEFLRSGRDDVGLQLAALKRFAAYCVSNLTEQEMRPVRRAVRLFIEQLRRESA